MELNGKIKGFLIPLLILISVFVLSCCKSAPVEQVEEEDPLVLAEITPLPKTVQLQKEVLYEPVYGVMRVLEITLTNGVQTELTAKKGEITKGLEKGSVGEISADAGFGEIIGTCKITGVINDFVTFKIENVTKKIPSNSYVRIVVGQKIKGE